MKLADQVLEEYKTLKDNVKSFLAKPNVKTKAVEDFFFDTDVSSFIAFNDIEDGKLVTKDWDVELTVADFTKTLLSYGEGEDVSIEDAQQLAPEMPTMIKNKTFEIDSFSGKVKDSSGTSNHRISNFIVAVKSAKYDSKKDVLTVAVEVESAELN